MFAVAVASAACGGAEGWGTDPDAAIADAPVAEDTQPSAMDVPPPPPDAMDAALDVRREAAPEAAPDVAIDTGFTESSADTAVPMDAAGPDAGADAGPSRAVCADCSDNRGCGPARACWRPPLDGMAASTALCVPRCADGGVCPSGFSCTPVPGQPGLCVPERAEACCFDEDGDGYGDGPGCLGADCDDRVPSTHARAPEACNGADDDCNGLTDDAVPMSACPGGRHCESGVCACTAPLLDCGTRGCVDLRTDPANCGGCGRACPAPPGGTAACADGTCGRACASGCGAYACDGTAGICRTGCSDPGDCAAGYACVAGTCRSQDGAACTSDLSCASGFCTDGVCCSARCAGACERCDAAGTTGRCTPVPAGTDPDSECTARAVSTCGTTGSCNGAGACALHPAGSVCGQPTCTVDGAGAYGPPTCDGRGACNRASSVSCGAYACDPMRAECRTTCSLGGDCAAGYACSGGTCRLAAGAPCTGDMQCASGFCTDGVCCGARCAGSCERCDLAGRAGQCDPVPAGQDPDDECASQPTSTCGLSGQCNGARACGLHRAGTVCGGTSCSTDRTQSVGVRTCNGTGVCQPGTTVPCVGALCDPTSGLCRTTCATSNDCPSGTACAPGGVCKKATGLGCAADAECASGFCTDGVCCGSRCNGTCQVCNAAGRAGSCEPVGAGLDPADECPLTSPTTCGTNGLCDGAGACARWPVGTVCNAAVCSIDRAAAQREDRCDSAGRCVDAGVQACSPFRCSLATGSCPTSCVGDNDCAVGLQCDSTSGQCRRPSGAACTDSLQCGRGFGCCGGRCVDLATDAANCGACGTACTNPHGTSACVSGRCTPSCDTQWRDCDGVGANGCETSLLTSGNCGGCGTVCSRPNASSSCSTGTCTLGTCNADYANCNGVSSDGCEANLRTPAGTCTTATDVGSHAGDASCGFPFCGATSWVAFSAQTGRGAAWFHGHVTEASSCVTDLTHRIVLVPPADVDYDLYVYSSCGTVWSSSIRGTGLTDEVVVSRSDGFAGLNSYDYWVEVRYFSGSSAAGACRNWTLLFYGRDC